MFSKELKIKIINSLRGLKVDAALIGSGTDKDLDIFIVNNENIDSYYQSTKPFLDRLQYLKNELACEIIVKHEHRGWVNKRNKRLVHLLFYPSYDHLQIWELPSFISCVYERGVFCVGSNKKLINYYNKYRSRKLAFDCDMFTFHILSLMDLAITNLIYLTINSTIFNKSVYFENLIYVYRYSLRESFISQLNEASKITFWEWDELLQHVISKTDLTSISSLFRLKETGSEKLTHDDIRLLFLEYLKLCDNNFINIDKLRINDILNNVL